MKARISFIRSGGWNRLWLAVLCWTGLVQGCAEGADGETHAPLMSVPLIAPEPDAGKPEPDAPVPVQPSPEPVSPCNDGMQNGEETDVDCGGRCPPCRVDQRCQVDDDCITVTCLDGVCVGPLCENGTRDESEADVDCGGECEALCLLGNQCDSGDDCETGVCHESNCCEPSSCGMRCGAAVDDGCGGTLDCGCEDGLSCSSAGVCCESGKSAADCGSCQGQIPDGCGGRIDCGGKYLCFGFDTGTIDGSDPGLLPASAPNVTLSADATLDSTGAGSLTGFDDGAPMLIDGGDHLVAVMASLSVAEGVSLQLVGDKPVVLVVFGDATVDGTIDASGRGGAAAGAGGGTTGAGGGAACSTGAGRPGSDDSNAQTGLGGGGGGAFGPGAAAGGGGSGTFVWVVFPVAGPLGGAAGASEAAAQLEPIRGGCPGGNGAGSNPASGGAGGGGVQLSVAGTLRLGPASLVLAGGGGGAGGRSGGGGGGGGSGGGIRLEAGSLRMDPTARVIANGGGGGGGAGPGNADGGTGADLTVGGASPGGAMGEGAGRGGTGGSRSAASPGTDAMAGTLAGGGGGGGSAGVIRIDAHEVCEISAMRASPAPITGGTCP